MTKKHTIICVICIALIVLFLILQGSDGPGIAYDVHVRIGPSEQFSRDVIESATNVVISEFGFLDEFTNRELVYLWYDEALSNQIIEESYIIRELVYLRHDVTLPNQTIDSAVIVFFSTITVVNPGLFPPGDLDNVGWVLVRDAQSGEWELIAKGFAGVNF